MSTIDSFDGFTKETIQFLVDLNENNNREWFQAHRQDFDRYVMEPAKSFVVSMGEALTKIAPNIHAEPKTDKSIFRIHRDTRFSPDKRPYKTNIAMWFWEGTGHRMENPGCYFHLEPTNLLLGSGIHTFSKSQLAKYRECVDDPTRGKKLEDAITEVTSRGDYSIGEEHYKRVPRGYDPDHERARLLRFRGLITGEDTEIPEELFSASLVDYCMKRYEDMLPIHVWLRELTESLDM